MKYYVEYNAKFIAVYMSLKRALNYIKRKWLRDDENNMLCVLDSKGNMYNPYNGQEL